MTTQDIKNSMSILGLETIYGYNYTRPEGEDNDLCFQSFVPKSIAPQNASGVTVAPLPQNEMALFYLDDAEIEIQKVIDDRSVNFLLSLFLIHCVYGVSV